MCFVSKFSVGWSFTRPWTVAASCIMMWLFCSMPIPFWVAGSLEANLLGELIFEAPQKLQQEQQIPGSQDIRFSQSRHDISGECASSWTQHWEGKDENRRMNQRARHSCTHWGSSVISSSPCSSRSHHNNSNNSRRSNNPLQRRKLCSSSSNNNRHNKLRRLEKLSCFECACMRITHSWAFIFLYNPFQLLQPPLRATIVPPMQVFLNTLHGKVNDKICLKTKVVGSGVGMFKFVWGPSQTIVDHPLTDTLFLHIAWKYRPSQPIGDHPPCSLRVASTVVLSAAHIIGICVGALALTLYWIVVDVILLIFWTMRQPTKGATAVHRGRGHYIASCLKLVDFVGRIACKGCLPSKLRKWMLDKN